MSTLIKLYTLNMCSFIVCLLYLYNVDFKIVLRKLNMQDLVNNLIMGQEGQGSNYNQGRLLDSLRIEAEMVLTPPLFCELLETSNFHAHFLTLKTTYQPGRGLIVLAYFYFHTTNNRFAITQLMNCSFVPHLIIDCLL